MSKLKMIGTIISTPPHGFMARSGTTSVVFCYEFFTFWRLLKVIHVLVLGSGVHALFGTVVFAVLSHYLS